VIHRRWGASLAKLIDSDDLFQQAWVFLLEGVGEPPKGLTDRGRQVWEIGQLTGRLNAWCRKMYRRVRHEAPLVHTDFEGDAETDGYDWVEALDLARSVCTDDELLCVYFRVSGYRGADAQEILGLTEPAYRKRLQRLRERLNASDE
jgi:hypothetical protein